MPITLFNVTSPRQTKYSFAVIEALKLLKHGTSQQIYDIVWQMYPEVSLTTVRRVASRLAEREVIGRAPKTIDACERYDISNQLHHHFICVHCSHLCDIEDNQQSRQAVQTLRMLSKRCQLTEAVTLQGFCDGCSKLSRVNNE